MFKKKDFCVIFCLLTFSLVISAEEKIPVIEHIYWEVGGLFDFIVPENPELSDFLSPEILFAFHVSPSPKSDAIFFELGGQSRLRWWTDYPQPADKNYWCGYRITITSSAIPDDIYVWNQPSLHHMRGEVIEPYPMQWHRSVKNTIKLAIERDAFLREFVFRPLQITYISTGEYVPNEIANSILNDLMDKGFDVEVTLAGQTEGVKECHLCSGWIHVTRISKK
jgi:hypothetical protein